MEDPGQKIWQEKEKSQRKTMENATVPPIIAFSCFFLFLPVPFVPPASWLLFSFFHPHRLQKGSRIHECLHAKDQRLYKINDTTDEWQTPQFFIFNRFFKCRNFYINGVIRLANGNRITVFVFIMTPSMTACPPTPEYFIFPPVREKG